MNKDQEIHKYYASDDINIGSDVDIFQIILTPKSIQNHNYLRSLLVQCDYDTLTNFSFIDPPRSIFTHPLTEFAPNGGFQKHDERRPLVELAITYWN